MQATKKPVDPLLAALCILLATLLAYWNAFAGTYQFDDYNVIANYSGVASTSAWWQSMPGIRPLLKLSYALNNEVPLPYRLIGLHAVNIALHVGNALLVFALLHRMRFSTRIAMIAALLFATHPIHTEAVTLLSGRSLSLMAFAYLTSIIMYLDSRRIVSLAAFLVAVSIRETAITLPAALILIEYQRGQTLRSSIYQTRGYWFVLGFILALFSLLPRYRHLAEISLHARPMIDNLITQSGAIFYLLRQWALPFSLNVDPLLPVFKNWNVFWMICSIGMTLLAGGGLWSLWRKNRWRWEGFAIVWFLLHLAPTNSLLPRLDIANERHLYLAVLGFYLLIAIRLSRIFALRPRTGIAVTTVLLIALGTGTHLRNRVYYNETAFWQDVATKNPDSSRAFNNLGYALAIEGKAADAWKAYSRAIELQPYDYVAPLNRTALCQNFARQLTPEQCPLADTKDE